MIEIDATCDHVSFRPLSNGDGDCYRRYCYDLDSVCARDCNVIIFIVAMLLAFAVVVVVFGLVVVMMIVIVAVIVIVMVSVTFTTDSLSQTDSTTLLLS